MHPVLFTIPFIDVAVYSYGLMLGIACVGGVHLGAHLAERRGLDANRCFWFFSLLILAGLVGSRVHELLANDAYSGKFFSSFFEIRKGGLTAYGGFLGAAVAWILLAKPMRMPFWLMGDCAAPTLGLGLGLARIGCFLYGCDYGLRTDGAWGVRFPKGSPAWQDQIADGLLKPDAETALPVFPAQLVSSVKGWILFVLCLWLLQVRRPKRQGTVILSFFLGYGILRALVEQVRGDHGRGLLLGVSQSTAIGLLTAAVALVFLFVPPLAALRPLAAPIKEEKPEESGGRQRSPSPERGGPGRGM
ncbi:prolipoprotein diacylglyceryl transferase [bacterium]|nr:prolipoprotein diacylglyceryl transferase [bacterium]